MLTSDPATQHDGGSPLEPSRAKQSAMIGFGSSCLLGNAWKSGVMLTPAAFPEQKAEILFVPFHRLKPVDGLKTSLKKSRYFQRFRQINVKMLLCCSTWLLGGCYDILGGC